MSKIYKLDKHEYKKLTTVAVTLTCIIVPDKINNKITQKEKKYEKQIQIKENCLITLKYHKVNFLNNLNTRLFKQVKLNLGEPEK